MLQAPIFLINPSLNNLSNGLQVSSKSSFSYFNPGLQVKFY